MDRRLLHYCERELLFLREMGAEFAREFPNVAGRLALDVVPCPDPYVERLLEGFAFLAARVHLKLDSEFPRFTQNLLQTVYPQYLAPTPSMAVVQFEPDPSEGATAEGFLLPRNTPIRTLLGKGDLTPTEYRTAHDVTLWPVTVLDAKYYSRELGSLDIPALGNAKAAVRLRLGCTAGLTFSQIKLDTLNLFIRDASDLQMRLYEQIFAHAAAVVVQPVSKPVNWRHTLPPSSIRSVGFDDKQAVLPTDARGFSGYRLLHEYFTLPARFMFFEIAGLAAAVQRCAGNELDIVILFDEADTALDNRVTAANFVPCCTPVINLFPKRADRIHLSDRFNEFQIIPDRTRPRDFEVYGVTRVLGHGAGANQETEFRPFYSARDAGDNNPTYYTLNRVPRTISEREQRGGRRSTYAGGDVYLSLVDAREAPLYSDLRQLSVETLCTNRDLPLFVPVGRGDTDFTLDTGAPVERIRSVSGMPTPPRPSHAEGEHAWRAVSHLSLNYLSITEDDPTKAPTALRDLLKLYADVSDPATRKQIEGIVGVSAQPITRRVAGAGPISFARGLEIAVRFDESLFEGSGVFLLGAVLEQFFARYVSINSFTETVIRTQEREQVIRWPARIGSKHML